jgi:hypothetical protein
MTIQHPETPENDIPKQLASPVRRALAAAGIQRLAQLTRFSEAEVKRWHGIGPKGLHQLRRSLDARGLSFKNDQKT